MIFATTRQPESQFGVLLIGHGTRDQRGTDEFLQLGRLLAERCGETPVEPALLEFQEPTIAQGWQTLVEQAVDHIEIAPLLLFAAGHAKSDIPDMVQQCRASSSVSVRQSRPLSRHPAIIELVVRRVNETLSHAGLDASKTALVMAGRGSHDPCATADMRVLAEIVRHRMKPAALSTAFYAMAQPRLPEVLTQVAETGDYESIVVHPHLLFHGRLYQAIVRQTGEVAEQFPNRNILTSGYLGPDPLVADAIADRCCVPLATP